MSFHSCRQARARLVALCTSLLLIVVGTGPASAAICHVSTAGNSGGIGSTWASPMDLQTALTTPGCSEVWVKAGAYTPGTTNADSFDIPPGVEVYGGFAGTESSRGERDASINLSILSGDIDNNDANAGSTHIDKTSADIVGSNSFHVVSMDGTTGTTITADTVLDGLIITGGDASGSGSTQSNGGGLYCNGGAAGSECSPTLSNLTFSGNRASGLGGAIYNNGSSDGNSSPSLSSVTFSGNSAVAGGAMSNDGSSGNSSPSISNVTFNGNNADNAGAIFNDGHLGISSPTLSNVTFSGNNADNFGGAMANYGQGGTCSPILSNVILWGNIATTGDSEISNASSTPTIDHSVVQGSGGSSSWNATLGTDGGGNLDVDPRLGALGDHGGSTATMLLGTGSSAVDAGYPAVCVSPPVNGVDQRGVFRFEGNSVLCDIGAVEMSAITDRIFADGFEVMP